MSILSKSLTLLLTTTFLSSAYSNDLVPIRSSSEKTINRIKNENGAITNTKQQFTNIQNGNKKKKQIKYYNKVMETAYIDIKNDDNELIISLGQINNIINNLLVNFDRFLQPESTNYNNILKSLKKICKLKELCSKNYNKYSTVFKPIIEELDIFSKLYNTVVSEYKKYPTETVYKKILFEFLRKNTRTLRQNLQEWAYIIANIYEKNQFQINSMNYEQTNLLVQACKALSKNNVEEAKEYLEIFCNNDINNNNVNGISDIITADKIKNLLENTKEVFSDKQINNLQKNIADFNSKIQENNNKNVQKKQEDLEKSLSEIVGGKLKLNNENFQKDLGQLCSKIVKAKLTRIIKPLSFRVNKNVNNYKLFSQTPEKINCNKSNFLQNRIKNNTNHGNKQNQQIIKRKIIQKMVGSITELKRKYKNNNIKENDVEEIINQSIIKAGTNLKNKFNNNNIELTDNNKQHFIQKLQEENKYTLSLYVHLKDRNNNIVIRNLIKHLLESKHLVQNSVIGYSHVKNESNDEDEKTLIAGIKKLQNYELISYIITKTYDQQKKDIADDYKEYVYSIIENHLVAPIVYKFFDNSNKYHSIISQEGDHYNLYALNTVGDINNIILKLRENIIGVVEVSFVTMFGKTEDGYEDCLKLNKKKIIHTGLVAKRQKDFKEEIREIREKTIKNLNN